MKMKKALESLKRAFSSGQFGIFVTSTPLCNLRSLLNMGSKYIIGSVLGSFAIAYLVDHYVADKKIFGGTTPTTVASKEWWEETDRKFDRGWPRTAGPPVVMNPISRQNFIVKDRVED